MIPQEYSDHQNTFCGALSVKLRSMDCSVQRPKELKKSTRPGNFTPTPTLYPLSGVSQFWRVGSGAGRNQSGQISTRSVQGFRSPRWPKIAISHWLEVSPLQ